MSPSPVKKVASTKTQSDAKDTKSLKQQIKQQINAVYATSKKEKDSNYTAQQNVVSKKPLTNGNAPNSSPPLVVTVELSN